jgi:hypothetical protein
MKTALAILTAALMLSAPAFADGVSLSKGVKLCKAESKNMPSPPKALYADHDETRVGETQLLIVFKARSPNGVSNKITCTIDNATGAVALKWKYDPGMSAQADPPAPVQTSKATVSPD